MGGPEKPGAKRAGLFGFHGNVRPDRAFLSPLSAAKGGRRRLEKTDALPSSRNDHAAAQARGDREAIARAGRELRYWSARRASADLVEATAGTDKVQFGSTVTIMRNSGRRQTFRIVGEDEAVPAKGTISYVSPLAVALVGKSTGDVVAAGRDDAEITAIG